MCRMEPEKRGLKTNRSLDAIEIDPQKVDIELIRRNLEVNPSPILSLYNHLLEKGIIKIV
jgi:hypothetical protein